MFRFLETIRIESGLPGNLAYHQARINRTLREMNAAATVPDLAVLLQNSSLPKDGLHKCRVIYTNEIETIETEPYLVKPVHSLQLVKNNEIEYGYKFEDRTMLMSLFEKRGSCDDILIVKDGLITDSLYANIIFKHGREWITPSSFLLAGTQRQYLLDQGAIISREIEPSDLKKFSSFKLINAMLLTIGPEVPVANIKTFPS